MTNYVKYRFEYPHRLRQSMAQTSREAMMSFLGKAINRAQHETVATAFGQALTEYIAKKGKLAWDRERGLFRVNHPADGWQVAVWMMPTANEITQGRR